MKVQDLVICLDPGMSLGHCAFVGDTLINGGVITSLPKDFASASLRLHKQFKDIVTLIKEYKVFAKQKLGVERLNIKVVAEDVTQTFRQTRNVGPHTWLLVASYCMIFAACGKLGVPLYTCSPSAIKKSFTGKGRADKHRMRRELRERFPELPDNEHIADAVGMYFDYLDKHGTQA